MLGEHPDSIQRLRDITQLIQVRGEIPATEAPLVGSLDEGSFRSPLVCGNSVVLLAYPLDLEVDQVLASVDDRP